MKASTTRVAYCYLSSLIEGREFNFRFYQKLSIATEMPRDIYHIYSDGSQKPPKGPGPQPWFHGLKLVKPEEKFFTLNGKKIIEEGYYEWRTSSRTGIRVYKYLDRLYVCTIQWNSSTTFTTIVNLDDFRYHKAYKVDDDTSICKWRTTSSGYGWWLSDTAAMVVAESNLTRAPEGSSCWYQDCNLDGALANLDRSYWRSDFRRFDFHYDEWNIYQFAVETYRYTGVVSVPGRLSSCLGRAYVSAVEDIPQLSCNSIANVLEVGGILMSFTNIFKSGGILKMIADNLKSAKKPAQLWLKYRYQFCTTKMDLSEMIDFSNRVDEMAASVQDISCKGQYADKDKTLYKCSIVYSPAQLVEAMPSSRKYGFELNAVNAWDMIPYSFVVDWFAHIGNTLQILQSYSNSFDYKPSEVWFSVTTTFKDEVVFMRLPGSGPCPTPTTISRTASGKTIFMRAADTLSLFF